LPEVGNRVDIGQALQGALPGLLPVADGLCGASRFSGVCATSSGTVATVAGKRASSIWATC
jgi:hypothetical protein